MGSPALFDAVLFDLDGTLVATDRFWLQAARVGARRAFDTLGLEREMPSPEAWLGLIGLDIRIGFRDLFPDLDEGAVRTIREACEEEERRLVACGAAAPMPGARDVLVGLRESGLRLGIASNCPQGYLDQMCGELGLRELVDEALCLDTPGIRSKTEMVERLLATFDTRSAVMVGDRMGDRDAAWSNGLPHVHCAFGFAGSEAFEAEAVIQDLGELPGALAGRERWIAGILERLGLLGPARGRGLPPTSVVGITGDVAAGKSLFARDAARVMRAAGRPAETVPLEAFRVREPDEATWPEELYDLDRLDAELLEPLARGESARAPSGEDAAIAEVLPGSVAFLEGPYLLEPRIASRLARTIHLEVSEEVRWRRLLGREGQREAMRVRDANGRGLAVHRKRFDPSRLADLVVDGANPLGCAEPGPGPGTTGARR